MTDTGEMNVQINDTPISQKDAIGAGVCVGGGVMLRLACLSGHLHSERPRQVFFIPPFIPCKDDLPKPNTLAPFP